MSLVVDEERMRSGHWLGLVDWDSFNALTLLVGWQEGHPAYKKNLCHLSPKEEESKGIQLTQVYLDNDGTVEVVYTHTHTHTHNRFTALFPGPPGWASARRELLDFMAQRKINGGRHTDHPAGCQSIRTNQCPPTPSPHILYRPDALPAAQPTASKHWRQLRIHIREQMLEFSSTMLPAPSP